MACKEIKIKALLGIILILLLAPQVAAQEQVPDFLLLKQAPILRPIGDTIEGGELFTGEVFLEKTSAIAIPDSAELMVETELLNPRIVVKINGNTFTYANKSIKLPLNPAEIKDVYIKVEAYAPEVKKLTKVNAMSIKTKVFYEYKNITQVQTEIEKSYSVLTSEIEKLVSDITKAENKLDELNQRIFDLRNTRDTTELELKSNTIRKLIETAKDFHEQGRIEEGKAQIDIALKNLDDLESEINNIEREQKLKKYGIAAVIVIIILIAIYSLRRQREELG